MIIDTVINCYRGRIAERGCPSFSMTDPFYLSKRWLRLRQSILRRDGYQCQYAKRFGKRAPATRVHHIFPRQEYPEYEWEPWNLISLSSEAHNKMHGLNGELSEIGKELMRRTIPARQTVDN